MTKRLTLTKIITKQELESLLEKALEQVETNGISKSDVLYKTILHHAKSMGEERIYGRCLLMLIWYYLDRLEYTLALECIHECISLCHRINEKEWLPRLYNWLGYIHKAKGDFSNAIDYYEMEIEANLNLGWDSNNVIAYNVLGNIYEYLDNSEIAESYLVKAKNLASKHSDDWNIKINLPHLNSSLIGLLTKNKRYSEAETLCYETIEFCNSNKSVERIVAAYIHYDLSLLKFYTGNYFESMEVVSKINKALFTKHKKLLLGVLSVKAYNYEALGDTDNATSFYKKSIALIDKVESIHSFKIELLKKASAFFDKIGLKKDSLKAQQQQDKLEIELQTLQTKLKLRYKSSISYGNVINQLNNSTILLPTIHNGIVKLNINAINACYTDNKSDKNVSKILVAEQLEEIRTRKSLKTLFDMFNNGNFVWIDRNAFVNKEHVSQWEQVCQKGIVNIAGKTFSISRSKRKELFNNHTKTQQA